MRRITAALAALVTALGLVLVVTGPAEAAITAPGNGSVLRGNTTLSASGATSNGTACLSGTSARTRFFLVNSGGATVFSNEQTGTGAKSVSIDTHSYDNGSYTVRVEEVNRSGFLACSNSTNTSTSAVTIDNRFGITYNDPLSAPQNTTLSGITANIADLAPTGLTNLAGHTISFALTGGGSTSGVTNAAGNVTVNLPVSGPPRTAALTIGYAGSARWGSTGISRSFDVTKNATTTTLTQPATIVHGEFQSFTATVAKTNGTGTPTGSVQFTVDGSDFGAPVSVNGSGVATTPATDALSTGTHTVGAVYSGDANFLTSTAATRTATTVKADTTTQLNAAPTPTKFGQAVTFTATIGVVAPGVGAPTGGVQFNIDGAPFGTAVPLSGNTAQLTVSNLNAGNHDVEAVYNGDADFNPSSSAVVTHGVERADTNLSLSTSDATAVSGQPLSYTANVVSVAPGAGVPAGQVQFEVDGQPLGGPVTLVNGQATSPTTSMLVGSHNVTANYLGNSNYAGSDSAYTQVVTPAQTDIVLTSSQNPSVFGQGVTFRAEVSPQAPSSGDPTGAVRFRVNGVTVATPDMVGGVAEVTLSNLPVGTHAVVARYLSDSTEFLSGSEDSLSQQVNKAATSTALVSSAPSSVFGQPVTFTASVTVTAPGAGAPTGDIVFKDGSSVLATVPVNSAFQATLTTSALAVGQHAITATYSGDGSFLGSNASSTQTVQKASTSTVVTSSNNPALTGQPTTFSAAVTPVAPGAGDPSGTVLFTINGLPLGGQRPIVDGVATSPSFSALTPGTYKVKAQYSGDGNFFKSDGLLDQGSGQFASKGATTLGLTGPATAAYNAPVTFDVTVNAVAPANGKPSGVVRFWEGGELLGSSSLVPAGTNAATASFVTSTLSPGSHTVRAEYVGNFNFTGSENTTSVAVGRAPTTTGVASSVNPATFGDSVTLTATVNEQFPTVGEPTGSVTFSDGAAVLGTSAISTVGGQQVATLVVPGLSGGAHSITAAYSGDTAFAGSTSPVYTQQVAQQAVTLVAGSPVAGSPLGTRFGYVRARLTDADGDPLVGRTISFTNKPFGSRPAYHLCSAVTNASGLAECDYTVINIDPSTDGEDLLIDVNGTYHAHFAGSGDYQGAIAEGDLF